MTFTALLGGPTTRQATRLPGCGTTSSTWTVDTTGLSGGVYSVTAASTDVAGNPEAAPVAQTFTIL